MKNSCLNLIANRKRKAGRDELRPMNSEDDQLGMDRIDNFDDDLDFSPENVAETKYVRKLLDDALSEIPAIRQTCLALNQQGLTYREIGEKLNIPEGTAKSHVRYAKLQLRKAIKEIENKENVELHGVVLVPGPFGLKLVGQVCQKKRWITAEVKKEKPNAKRKKALLSEPWRRAIAAVLVAVTVTASVIFNLPPKSLKITPSAPKLAQVQELQAIPLAKGAESKQTGVSEKRVQHSQKSGSLKSDFEDKVNEFYDPNWEAYGSGIQIVPYHIWFQDGKMYADCYVVNLEPNIVSNITVDRLSIGNSKGTFSEASFEEIPDLKLDPNSYATHRFIFLKDSYQKADLTHKIYFSAETTWTSNGDKPSDLNNKMTIPNSENKEDTDHPSSQKTDSPEGVNTATEQGPADQTNLVEA